MPSAWARRWLAQLGPGIRVLDFASGSGRNIPMALAQGARVLAVDRDGQAVQASGALTQSLQADLEGRAWPAELDSFDVVMCCNYLFRPRLDLLAALVAPGGLFLYETFAQGNEAFGRPANPDFLLRPGELIEVAQRARLVVLAYEHGYVDVPKPALVQRLCAVRPPFDARRLCVDAGGVG